VSLCSLSALSLSLTVTLSSILPLFVRACVLRELLLL
jgi:hypothetical protein